MKTRNLWIGFILVLTISFGILGFFGSEIYRKAPPVPEQILTTNGTVLMTSSDIKDGQNVWQSMGGQEVGSVWGHGAYKAPDWTADWLHREAVFILNHWSGEEFSTSYENLDTERRAMLESRLKEPIRWRSRRSGHWPSNRTVNTIPACSWITLTRLIFGRHTVFRLTVLRIRNGWIR